MNRLYGYDRAEWLYWYIKPVLLVEEYLKGQFDQLVDYKLFCYNE